MAGQISGALDRWVNYFEQGWVSSNERQGETVNNSFFMRRAEVLSKNAESHLGNVIFDGSAPTGLRYCINSAALRAIPKEDLEKEGYGQYLKLFEEKK